MFWFGCSDDDDCGSDIERRLCERECCDVTTPVPANHGDRTAATSRWMEFFDVLDNSQTANESCIVLHHGKSGSAHSPIDVDVLESSASSVASECAFESAGEQCTSPTSTSSSGSDVEWQAGGADADMLHLPERSASSSSSIDDADAKDRTPLFFGAAARFGAVSHKQRQAAPNAAPPRRSHPSFEEWRAEKLDESSLKEAFFGVGHKCINLWNGKGCHVNLWGDAETGLQALKAQRA